MVFLLERITKEQLNAKKTEVKATEPDVKHENTEELADSEPSSAYVDLISGTQEMNETTTESQEMKRKIETVYSDTTDFKTPT